MLHIARILTADSFQMLTIVCSFYLLVFTSIKPVCYNRQMCGACCRTSSSFSVLVYEIHTADPSGHMSPVSSSSSQSVAVPSGNVDLWRVFVIILPD